MLNHWKTVKSQAQREIAKLETELQQQSEKWGKPVIPSLYAKIIAEEQAKIARADKEINKIESRYVEWTLRNVFRRKRLFA